MYTFWKYTDIQENNSSNNFDKQNPALKEQC